MDGIIDQKKNVMDHQAFRDVKNDIHHILEDTKRLTEDSLSLVADVERLEKNCKEHWKELLLDFLCSLCFYKIRNSPEDDEVEDSFINR